MKKGIALFLIGIAFVWQSAVANAYSISSSATSSGGNSGIANSFSLGLFNINWQNFWTDLLIKPFMHSLQPTTSSTQIQIPGFSEPITIPTGIALPIGAWTAQSLWNGANAWNGGRLQAYWDSATEWASKGKEWVMTHLGI